MKIFLDDIRDCPADLHAEVARNFTLCKIWIDIAGDNIEFIDLDYDLGSSETGLDVLIYMFEKGITPEAINIHSDHPIGSIEMIRYAEDHFKNSLITANLL